LTTSSYRHRSRPVWRPLYPGPVSTGMSEGLVTAYLGCGCSQVCGGDVGPFVGVVVGEADALQGQMQPPYGGSGPGWAGR